MRTLKKTALLFLLVLQTAAIFARGNAEAPSQNNGQLPEISIGILPDVDSIPVVIAHLNGYFEENGIKVQIQQFKNPVDRDTAFQAGDTNLVISDLLSAALFRNGGFNVKALSLTNGSYKMLAAPASGAENIQDMTGKSIGISKKANVNIKCHPCWEGEKKSSMKPCYYVFNPKNKDRRNHGTPPDYQREAKRYTL